jgi:hypothetical protein
MKASHFFKSAELVLGILPHVAKELDFALKGGSAINLFVQDLPRLSVDIDLTYLPIKPRNASLTHIGAALGRIAESIKRAMPGVKIQETKYESRYVVKLFIDYQEIRIKIEPNIVIRGTVFPSEVRELVPHAKTLFELGARIQTLSVADIYGGKLCAALDRQHPRDIFDVKVLMENEGITDEIRRAFVIYLVGHPRPMSELLDPKLQDIRGAYNGEFRGLSRVEVSFEELVTVREEFIALLNRALNDEERLFLLSIKLGEPRWELMGIDGIENLPAIRWKLLNVEKMGKKKHLEAVGKLKTVLGL